LSPTLPIERRVHHQPTSTIPASSDNDRTTSSSSGSSSPSPIFFQYLQHQHSPLLPVSTTPALAYMMVAKKQLMTSTTEEAAANAILRSMTYDSYQSRRQARDTSLLTFDGNKNSMHRH